MKLIDELGTIYVYDEFRDSVVNIIKQCKEQGSALDITGSKLSIGMSNLLSDGVLSYNVKLMDEDEARNNICKQINEYVEIPNGTLPLPKPFRPNTFIDTVKSLDSNVTYRVSNDNVSLYFAMLVSLLRPNIQIDIRSLEYRFNLLLSKTVMSAVSPRGILDLSEDIGITIDLENTVVVKATTGTIDLGYFGKHSFIDCTRKFIVYPNNLGTFRLKDLEGEASYLMWSKVFKKICTAMEGILASDVRLELSDILED